MDVAALRADKANRLLVRTGAAEDAGARLFEDNFLLEEVLPATNGAGEVVTMEF